MAQLAVNATLEKAYGDANKTIFEAKAVAATVGEVTKMQAESFKVMKANLTFENQHIIKYQQNSLVKDYDSSRLALHIQ